MIQDMLGRNRYAFAKKRLTKIKLEVRRGAELSLGTRKNHQKVISA